MSGTNPFDSVTSDAMQTDQDSPSAPDTISRDDAPFMDRLSRILKIIAKAERPEFTAQASVSDTTRTSVDGIMYRSMQLLRWIVWREVPIGVLEKAVNLKGGRLVPENLQKNAERLEAEGDTYEDTIESHLKTCEEAIEDIERRLVHENLASNPVQLQTNNNNDDLESLWRRLDAIELDK